MSGAESWAARWRSLVVDRDHQRGTDQRDGDPKRDPWTTRADRFAAYSQQVDPADPFWRRIQAALRPTDTVLDVGAGAGRYAAPLAQRAKTVIAVEPSPAMRQHLAARLADAPNVQVVGAAWPTDDLPIADLTICAHVVYGVREIAPFLRALDQHTRRLCLIAIRVDQPPGLEPLSKALFGAARVPQPALLDLYGALLELGIAADVQIFPATGSFRFADQEGAVAHYRDRLRLPPASAQADQLRELVLAQLIQDADGQWRWPGPVPRTAIVSWSKDAPE